MLLALLAAAGPLLSNLVLGMPALQLMRDFGPPDRIITADEGHEWQWYEARGFFVAVLTDDQLAVHEIAAMHPERNGKYSNVELQPGFAPVLGASRDAAAQRMAHIGAPLAESNPDVLAWRANGGVTVAEFDAGAVRRVVTYDEPTAANRGYIAGAPPTPSAYHAPRLTHVASVGYPNQAMLEGAQGVVILRVMVDTHGRAQDVSVLRSSGHIDIDRAEISSIKMSTFEPARCGDVPCAGLFFDREEYSLGR